MGKIDVKRNYKCSDGILEQRSDHLSDLVERDKDAFATRGVTEEKRTAFKALNTDFTGVITDVVMRGLLRDATTVKDNLRAVVLKECVTIRTMAVNKWGEDSPKYTIYGWEGMSELKDSDLVRHARMVVYVAGLQLALADGLASEGLTDAMITNLSGNNTDFNNAIDAVSMAICDRALKTQERIIKGNILYKEFVRLSNIGKDLFHGSDPARYEEYLIGMSGVSDADADDQFGSISGTVTNSANDEVLAGVQLTLKGEGLPDLLLTSDDAGLYADDHVITKYTSLVAVMEGFVTRTITIVIPPDDTLLLNIAMTAV